MLLQARVTCTASLIPAVYVTGVYPEQPLPDYTPPQAPGTYGMEYESSGPKDIFVAVWLSVFLALMIAIITRLRYVPVAVRKRGKKLAYIQPKLSVEGAGPAKDVLPVEYAVLDRQDLDRIAAIVFFEMVLCGVVEIAGVRPLRLTRREKPLGGFPPYFIDFAEAIREDGEVSSDALRKALTLLIENTEAKVTGFHLRTPLRISKNGSQKPGLR